MEPHLLGRGSPPGGDPRLRPFRNRRLHFVPERHFIAISIDPVIQRKLDALDALESQFYEGGANGYPELIPSDPARQQERHRQVRAGFEKHAQDLANRFRSKLAEFYGQDKAASIQTAEAFEICEYGRHPDKEELKKLFPFFEQ
ncbi:MAG: hypothetical protein ACLQVX_17940 [Limisphaerales bacterium]